jgi:hypothetical protein
MFGKLDLFPSSGEGETPTLLGLSERANLNTEKIKCGKHGKWKRTPPLHHLPVQRTVTVKMKFVD